MATTENLIAEYNERRDGQFTKCNLGSSRWNSRQAKINAIVDELSNRADNGDTDAIEFFTPRMTWK